MGKRIVLDFKNGEIHIQEKFKNDEFKSAKSYGRLELKDFSEQIDEGLPEELIRSLKILDEVEKWLNLLTEQEKEVVFWRYINHDFEREKGFYKTLSFEKIGEKLGIDKKKVWRIAEKAIGKIIQHIEGA